MTEKKNGKYRIKEGKSLSQQRSENLFTQRKKGKIFFLIFLVGKKWENKEIAVSMK